MKNKILVLLITLFIPLFFSYSQQYKTDLNNPSYQMLKVKCAILEKTIEITLAVLKQNEKRYQNEKMMFRAKIDGMYNKLILGEQNETN